MLFSELIIHVHFRDKLAPINLSKYKEDLLFYLFYTHFGEVIQMSVSDELLVITLFFMYNIYEFNILIQL